MAQNIAAVDQAWEDKFSGAAITTGVVDFFQETPDESEAPTRTYPSFAITLADWAEDAERREGETGPDELMKVGEDLVASPRESIMKAKGTPWRLIYELHTWAKGRARDDRELQLLVATKLGERGTLLLTGTEEDGSDEVVWAFRADFTNADEDDADVTLYHKIHTFEVLVNLRDDTEIRVKQAERFELDVDQGSDPATSKNDITLVVEV